jgi:hypothetical protein
MTKGAVAGEIVVLHETPDAVAPFLLADEREQIRFVTRSQVSLDADGLEGGAGADTYIVSLPVDGPPVATRLAVALLSRERSLVCVHGTGHEPVDWWVLDLPAAESASRVVGLDLRPVRWHDDTGLWWTSRQGPVWLPLSPAGSAAGRRTASVLVALPETVASADRVTDWLGTVAAGAAADSTQWNAALCARYLGRACQRPCAPRAHQRRGSADATGTRPSTTRGSN